MNRAKCLHHLTKGQIGLSNNILQKHSNCKIVIFAFFTYSKNTDPTLNALLFNVTIKNEKKKGTILSNFSECLAVK